MRFKIYLSGEWPASQVEHKWGAEQTPWPAQLQHASAQHWQRATAKNPRLFNGRLASLRQFETPGGRLILHLNETCYRDQLFSNTQAKSWLEAGRDELPARGLGISALVETSDNQLVLIFRSAEVAEYPNAWDVLGGHIDPGEHLGAGGMPDVFVAMAEELQSELGLVDEPEELVCIGLLENAAIAKPELVFRTRLGLTVADVEKLALQANERFEYTRLHTIPATAAGVTQFMMMEDARCTPSASGCLFLYSLQLLSSG